MDSIAIAYWIQPAVAITIDYGQRPAPGEIRAATAASRAMGIEHYIIRADLSALGSGDLSGEPTLAIAPVSEWWPFRNQMLVTLGAMKAVSLGIQRVLIGSLKTDEIHADGSADFVSALSSTLQLQEGNLVLEAPAISMTATELIKASGVPFDVLAWAHSCHSSEYACGECRGCRKHYETLRDLGEEPY